MSFRASVTSTDASIGNKRGETKGDIMDCRPLFISALARLLQFRGESHRVRDPVGIQDRLHGQQVVGKDRVLAEPGRRPGAMAVGMVPMALALERGSELQAPLGRAVIGGLVVSTFVTLLIVPSIFALLMGRRTARSPSLHPDDPDSAHYDPAGCESEAAHEVPAASHNPRLEVSS